MLQQQRKLNFSGFFLTHYILAAAITGITHIWDTLSHGRRKRETVKTMALKTSQVEHTSLMLTLSKWGGKNSYREFLQVS